MQLLGNFGSRKPPDLPHTYAQYQYETAKARGLKILQWRRPDLDLAAVSHRDKPLLEGPDVLAVGLEEFSRRDPALPTRQEQPKPRPAPRQTACHVFINADRSDKELADALLKIFEDKARTTPPPAHCSKAPPRISSKTWKPILLNCGVLLLLYGSAPPAWVRAQLLRYSKLERQRDAPLRLKSIVLGPPASEARTGLVRRLSDDRLSGRRSRTTHSEHARRIAALSAPASQRLPYPGLRSFRRDESDLFFGREDCVNGMVDRLAATRLLAVLGSSGTGKSSVVKTGLLDGARSWLDGFSQFDLASRRLQARGRAAEKSSAAAP